MKYLRLAIREPAARRNPMHTLLMEDEVAARTELWNWHAGDGLDLLLFRVVGDRDAYVDVLADQPFVVAYETAPIDAESFYCLVESETRPADEPLREPFLDQRVLTMPPMVFADDGEVRMDLIGRAADVQRVVDGLPDDVDCRVDRVDSYERGVRAPAALLTDRQREAVAAADAVGYYDVPRTGSLADVADRLDCSPSTASHHLRTAHAHLVSDLLGE